MSPNTQLLTASPWQNKNYKLWITAETENSPRHAAAQDKNVPNRIDKVVNFGFAGACREKWDKHVAGFARFCMQLNSNKWRSSDDNTNVYP